MAFAKFESTDDAAIVSQVLSTTGGRMPELTGLRLSAHKLAVIIKRTAHIPILIHTTRQVGAF